MDSNVKMIDLTIITLDSQNHKFSVPDTFTILELKEFIAAQVNVEVVQQRLIFCGRVLSNETKLADIGIVGQVIHLVQEVPCLSTTTSGSSSSTITNTSRHSGQNAILGFRELPTHHPTDIFGAIAIPSESIHSREFPRVLNTENHGTCARMSVPLDMIRRGNEILNILESLRTTPPQSSASNAEQYPEGSQQNEVSNVPVGGSTNQSSVEQGSGTLPSSPSSEQHTRNDRQTSENISTVAVDFRQNLRELLEELNKLNERFQPFYAVYYQHIIDGPRVDTVEGELGVQSIFSGVPEVMHLISHVYHAIGDMRIPYNTAPQRSLESRSCLHQSTIINSAHSVSTDTTAAPLSTQQPTSTQTTTTSQSIPSVRLFRLDYVAESETYNVSTLATATNTNTDMSVDPNTESNNSPAQTLQGVEQMFGLAPGFIRSGSVEGVFFDPNECLIPGLPAALHTPLQPSATIADPAMTTTLIDQMIDGISSGGGRPLVSEQSLESNSITTTSTQAQLSSSTTNPSTQGLARRPWDPTTRMDPFLPCSSNHFEPKLIPILRAFRLTQGTTRSTSSTQSGNATTEYTSSPTAN